jgi:hypothetical protein
MRHRPFTTDRILAPASEMLPRKRERRVASDFAYRPVKARSNERKHNRDHKQYRRPEQQIVASD